MPVVERDLGQIWLYGWVFSAFYIGTLIGAVVGGNVVDRVRPIGPMIVGIAVFAAGLAIGGLAVNMEMLVGGRLLQGLGAGIVPAVAYVVVARGFPADLHPKVFAAMSTAWVMPALVSPLLAAFIARHIGWRWVFLGLIPVTLVVAAIGAPRVATVGSGRPVEASDPVDGDARAHRRIIWQVLLLAVGAAVTVSGLEMSKLWIGLPLATVGAVVLVLMFTRLTPTGTLLFVPRLPAAVMLRGVLTYAFFSADAFVSLAVTSVRGMTTTFAGVALVISSGTWTVGSWVQARLMNSERSREVSSRLVRTGGLLIAVGASGMVASLSTAVPVWGWLISGALSGLGMGLAYTTISVVTLAEAEPGKEGEATAALQLSDILGVAMGTGVAGAIVAIGDRLDASTMMRVLPIYVVTTIGGLVAAVAAGRLGVRRNAEARAQADSNPASRS